MNSCRLFQFFSGTACVLWDIQLTNYFFHTILNWFKFKITNLDRLSSPDKLKSDLLKYSIYPLLFYHTLLRKVTIWSWLKSRLMMTISRLVSLCHCGGSCILKKVLLSKKNKLLSTISAIQTGTQAFPRYDWKDTTFSTFPSALQALYLTYIHTWNFLDLLILNLYCLGKSIRSNSLRSGQVT